MVVEKEVVAEAGFNSQRRNSVGADTGYKVYDDALNPLWQDWSWGDARVRGSRWWALSCVAHTRCTHAHTEASRVEILSEISAKFGIS
jgi:hypothetical protein